MKDSYERIIKNIIDEKLIVIVPNQKSNETNFQAIKYVYEENTKLKAENEQLNGELGIWQSTNFKLVCELTRIECENNQLKSELEKSVKLPCKCEDCKYADFMSASAERFYCMEHRRYMNVGGYCSFGKAEQSLKGGAD